MLARVTLLLCLLAFCAPAAAVAQDSPFAPLPPAQTLPDEPPTQTSSSADDGGGLAKWQEILIFLGAGALLAGIAWAIVSDARSHAPGGDETETRTAAKAAAELEHKRRKAKARAADKRARAARKRNR